MDAHAQPLSSVRQALIGLAVAHVWRGHGSAIFLEFGVMSPPSSKRDGCPANPCGEWSLGIEWNWRFERPRSILGGAWSDPRRWPAFFRAVLGTKVEDLRTVGTLPEIEMWFSNGMRLSSFMNDAGQPQWYFLDRRSPLVEAWYVERGRIVCRPQASSRMSAAAEP